MSMDPLKDRKSYEITFKGSREDLDALGAVLDEAVKKFDVDLYPKEKDIPGRISLVKGTAFQFSRVRRGLKELADALKSADGSAAINLGDIDLKEGRLNEPKEEWLAIMDGVTDSRRKQAVGVGVVGKPIHDTMKDNKIFTDQEYSERGHGRPELLTEANMRWMYAESLVGPEPTASKIMLKTMREVEGIKDYPPKLNSEDKRKLKKWAKSHDFNRAYIVVLEVDKWMEINMPVHTKPGDWDSTIKELAMGSSALKFYEGKPPKTVGDLYIRIAAYASARAFEMKDAVVMPFNVSDMGTMPLVGPDDFKKIYPKKAALMVRTNQDTGEKYPDYRNFMAFLVVGRGPYISTGLTRVPEAVGDDIILPDL